MKNFLKITAIFVSMVGIYISSPAVADEICTKNPDESNSCGGGTVGDLGLGIGTGGGTGAGAGGGGGGFTGPTLPVI